MGLHFGIKQFVDLIIRKTNDFQNISFKKNGQNIDNRKQFYPTLKRPFAFIVMDELITCVHHSF